MSRNNSYHSAPYHQNDNENRHQRQQQQEGRRNERYYGQTHHQQHHYRDYPSRHYQRQQQEQEKEQYSKNALPPLPPGWVETTDPSTGTTYYANSTTQESQWDRPHAATTSIPLADNSTHKQQQQQNHHHHQHQSLSNRTTAQMQVPILATHPHNGGIHTDRTTVCSTREGNNFYAADAGSRYTTATTNNPAMWHPEKIVHVTREMLEKVQNALPDQTVASDLELHSLTPGQVADLCKLQRRIQQQQQRLHEEELQEYSSRQHSNSNDSSGNIPPYTPINPYIMPISGSILMDRTEPGRLDVRMNSLRRELEKIGHYKSLAD
jgi:hypothetical protein